MAIYDCFLTEEELVELDTLLAELNEVTVFFAEEIEYDSWQEAEETAAEVIALIQRGEEAKALLFREVPVAESLLLGLVNDLSFLVDLADILHNLGYTGSYRLKRRAERMIEILDESCIEL